MRLRLAVLMMSLTLGLALPANVAAYYYTTCGNPLPDGASIWHQYQDAPVIEGAIGVVTIRALHACTGGSGFSAVFAVNLQDSDCMPFVQLGYATVGSAVNWWFTPNDNSTPCGLVSPVSSYVPNVPGPIIGRTYELSIGNSTGLWLYNIRDLTTGTVYSWARTAHGSSVTKAWWGIEAHNVNDQFGYTAASMASIANLRYTTSYSPTGSIWIYETTARVGWSSSPPSYMHGVYSIDGNGRVVVKGYTNNR